MELLLFGACVIGVIAWIAAKAGGVGQHTTVERDTDEPSSEEVRRRAEARRRQRLRTLNTKARALQLALIQLPCAHDFRRAASTPPKAKKSPLPFAKGSSGVSAKLLVRHFITRVRAGADAAVLLQSLRQLLGYLAVPAYEADYIRDDAQAALSRPAAPQRQPSYAERLAALQREHEQRMHTLRTLDKLDPETREQMLEAEETRFRQAIQDCGTAVADAPAR